MPEFRIHTVVSARFSRLAAALALLGAAAMPAGGADKAAAAPAPSLYTRLGGYDFLAKFVDTAFPRVAGHPQLSRLFRGHSRDSQIRQRQLIVDALCQATGGPCAYTGRAMKPVHTGLGITPADWTTFTTILGAALEELKVPPPERKEFLDLLESRFRPDVVETRSIGSGAQGRLLRPDYSFRPLEPLGDPPDPRNAAH